MYQGFTVYAADPQSPRQLGSTDNLYGRVYSPNMYDPVARETEFSGRLSGPTESGSGGGGVEWLVKVPSPREVRGTGLNPAARPFNASTTALDPLLAAAAGGVPFAAPSLLPVAIPYSMSAPTLLPTHATPSLVGEEAISPDEQQDLQRIQQSHYRVKMLPPPLPFHVHRAMWRRNEYADEESGEDVDGHAVLPSSQQQLQQQQQQQQTPSSLMESPRQGGERSEDISPSHARRDSHTKLLGNGDAQSMSSVSSFCSEDSLDKEQRLEAYRLIMSRWYRHIHVLENKPEVRQRVVRTRRTCPTLDEVRARLQTGGVVDEEELLSRWSKECTRWWQDTFKRRTRRTRNHERRDAELSSPADVAAATGVTAPMMATNAFTSAVMGTKETPWSSQIDAIGALLTQDDHGCDVPTQPSYTSEPATAPSLLNLTQDLSDDEHLTLAFTTDLLKTIEDE